MNTLKLVLLWTVWISCIVPLFVLLVFRFTLEAVTDRMIYAYEEIEDRLKPTPPTGEEPTR